MTVRVARCLNMSVFCGLAFVITAAACDRNPGNEGSGTPANPPVGHASTNESVNTDPHAGIPNAPRLDPHAGVPNAPRLDPHAGVPNAPRLDPHAGVPNAPPLGPQAGATDPHAGIDMDALEPTAAPTGAPEAGGLTWIAPTSFSRQTPASSMRAAEYVFRGSDDAATLTVFFFGAGQGGSVQANLDRWIGQFLQPDGTSSTDAAQTTRLEMNGLRASIVDLSGTFVGGGMMPGAPTTSQPGQRMLAAIVEGPGGPVFFKLVGSEALIAEALAPFRTLVDSVRPST